MPRANRRMTPQYAHPIPSDAPFQIGDRVVVHGAAVGGHPIVEGHGVVIGGGASRHSYLVRIDDKPMAVYRIIKPGLSQTAPLRFIAIKRAAYRARLKTSPEVNREDTLVGPSRQKRITEFLASHNDVTVAEIAAGCGLTRVAVYEQIKVMERAGMVGRATPRWGAINYPARFVLSRGR
jgi:hypothetical protein